MENTFLINSSLTLINIKDAMCSRLTKTRAIVSCLSLAVYEEGDVAIDMNTISQVLSVVEDYLDELDILREAWGDMSA